MKIVVLPNIQPGKLVIATPGEKEIVIENKMHAALVLTKIIDLFFETPDSEKVTEGADLEEQIVNPAWNAD